MGGAALSAMLAKDAFSKEKAKSPTAGLPGFPHFEQKVKRVIFLCMAGGPSHLETFDYKPKLAELDGQPMPESFTKGQPIAQLQGKELKCQGPLTKFGRYGENGQTISDFLPWHQKMADDICIIKPIIFKEDILSQWTRTHRRKIQPGKRTQNLITILNTITVCICQVWIGSGIITVNKYAGVRFCTIW